MLNVNSHSRIEYMFRFFEQMPDMELQLELGRAKLALGGSRKQMIARLRNHYRKGLIELRRPCRTEHFYDYLIAIDFECTCEEGEYQYDHEIIEFPAVLVSVRSRKIVDSFRTLVRPRQNPHLTQFCMNLTGITQAQIDQAPSFPEAVLMFRDWMSKHGLDGIENVGVCRRFCYVTDGPWDIAKFFQAECIRWEMPIPHDFRSFLNLRRAFINFYCQKERLPLVDLTEMLKRLQLTFEGNEHCGMDDTGNISKILIRMLYDNAELRVNEKLVNASHMLPWHRAQPVFPPAHCATTMAAAADEQQHDGTGGLAVENGEGSGGENGEAKTTERHRWWDALPYQLVKIRRDQFLGELFLECESCDECDEAAVGE